MPIHNSRLRDRALAEIVQAALKAPIAIVAPPEKGANVILTNVGSKFYNRVEITEPRRILGVYDGQKIAMSELVQALIDDLKEACVGMD